MSKPQKSAAETFVDEAPSGCKLCKNFGTASCPAFQKAVDDLGITPQELAKTIAKDQDGQDLNACDNG